jgi:hypothetical protein
VFLSLNQGTTSWENGDFKALPVALLKQRVDWARRVLRQGGADLTSIDDNISLKADTDLAKGYERGNIASVAYERDRVPTAEVLSDDLVRMCGLLAMLYEAQDAGDVPGEQPSEIAEAEATVSGLAGKRGVARRAGFRPNVAQRRAIEMRAMDVARDQLVASGWKVEDVSATQPYDLRASRGVEELHVEVKGTTSDGQHVLLTRGEVVHHSTAAPASALFVVSGIVMRGAPQAPSATGGSLFILLPWTIDEMALTPVGYQYVVPSAVV